MTKGSSRSAASTAAARRCPSVAQTPAGEHRRDRRHGRQPAFSASDREIGATCWTPLAEALYAPDASSTRRARHAPRRRARRQPSEPAASYGPDRQVIGLAGLVSRSRWCSSAGIGQLHVPPAEVLGSSLHQLGLDLGPMPSAPARRERAVGRPVPARRCSRSSSAPRWRCAGALMQGMFGNPLADPGVIGVSSGAAVGACARDRVRADVRSARWTIAVAAFVGGLAATLLVYALVALGRPDRGGHADPHGHRGERVRGRRASRSSPFIGGHRGARADRVLAARAASAARRWDDGRRGRSPSSSVGVVAACCWPGGWTCWRSASAPPAPRASTSSGCGMVVDRRRSRCSSRRAVAFAGIIAFVGLVVPHLIRMAARARPPRARAGERARRRRRCCSPPTSSPAPRSRTPTCRSGCSRRSSADRSSSGCSRARRRAAGRLGMSRPAGPAARRCPGVVARRRRAVDRRSSDGARSSGRRSRQRGRGPRAGRAERRRQVDAARRARRRPAPRRRSGALLDGGRPRAVDRHEPRPAARRCCCSRRPALVPVHGRATSSAWAARRGRARPGRGRRRRRGRPTRWPSTDVDAPRALARSRTLSGGERARARAGPACSPRTPGCCCSTSRPPRSTCATRRRVLGRCAQAEARRGRRGRRRAARPRRSPRRTPTASRSSPTRAACVADGAPAVGAATRRAR